MSFAPSRHQPRQRRELPPPLGAPERVGVSKANAAKASRPMRPKDADGAKPAGARRRLVAGGGGSNAIAQKQKRGYPNAEDEKAKYLAELSTDSNSLLHNDNNCSPIPKYIVTIDVSLFHLF